MAKNFNYKWNKTTKQMIQDKGINEKLNLYVAETCYKHMFDFVPFDNGILATNVDINVEDDHAEIRFNQPYAHYQYNGTDFNFDKTKHSLATHHWDKAMWTMYKDKITNQVNRYRKEIAHD